jgi:hypothetical protein
MEMKGQIL